jgi:hypothetical protein
MFGSSSHTLYAATIVAAAPLVLLTPACGSSSNGMHVSSSPGPVKTSTGGSVEHVQLQSEYLRFARCIRSHGVSDFPDPITGSGGHPGFRLQGGSSSDLNSNNRTFQRATATCQHILGHEFKFIFTPSGTGKGS